MSLVLTVRNFGPIVEGSVTLRPLNVFVGPNNTGKSFMSAFIYSAMAPSSRRVTSAASFLRVSAHLDEFVPEAIIKIRQQLERGDRVNKVFSSMPVEDRSFLIRAAEADLIAYARAVADEIERCLAGPLSDVVRTSSNRSGPMELTIRDSDLSWCVKITCEGREPRFSLYRPPRTNLLVQEADKIIAELFGHQVPGRSARRRRPPFADLSVFTEVSARERGAIFEDLSRQVARVLFEELHSFLFVNLPPNRHYLPASRSGIMQSHKLLTSVLVSNAAFVGVRRLDFPQLSGIVADFISQLLTLDYRRRDPSESAKLAGKLEDVLLHGRVAMTNAPNSYPEILYKTGELTAPLVRVSSMVSELAPLVLYLRHVVRRGQHMILEEPEAHLHPESQRNFARILAELSSAGVSLTLTTHSDYFLTEINNVIRETVINAQLQQDTQVLPVKDVAAYLFDPRPRIGGTVVRKLKVSATDGIQDDEFGRVAQAIYDEATALQYHMMDAGINAEDAE